MQAIFKKETSVNITLCNSTVSDIPLHFRGNTVESLGSLKEGGVRVCGIAVLGYFWCGVAVTFISKYGIAVFRAQAVCGKFKFHVAVVGEISLFRGDLLLFHDKRIQILKALPG